MAHVTLQTASQLPPYSCPALLPSAASLHAVLHLRPQAWVPQHQRPDSLLSASWLHLEMVPQSVLILSFLMGDGDSSRFVRIILLCSAVASTEDPRGLRGGLKDKTPNSRPQWQTWGFPQLGSPHPSSFNRFSPNFAWILNSIPPAQLAAPYLLSPICACWSQWEGSLHSRWSRIKIVGTKSVLCGLKAI